jgi:hypothetical protein
MGAAPKPMYLDIAAPSPSVGLCWVSGAHAPGDTSTDTIGDRTTFSIRWIEHALAAVNLTLHDGKLATADEGSLQRTKILMNCLLVENSRLRICLSH